MWDFSWTFPQHANGWMERAEIITNSHFWQMRHFSYSLTLLFSLSFSAKCVCSKLLGSSDVTLNVFVFAVHDLQSFGLDNVSSSTDVFSFACLSFCNNCHVLFSPLKHISCLYKSPVSSLWWCMSSSLVIWTYLSLCPADKHDASDKAPVVWERLPRHH